MATTALMETSSLLSDRAPIVAALMNIQSRNVEAMARAQTTAFAGLGELAKQQQDIFQTTLRSAVNATAKLDFDLRAAVVSPIETLKNAMQDSSANSNMLNEVAARSAANVADILQTRMMASLDELKEALLKVLPAAKA